MTPKRNWLQKVAFPVFPDWLGNLHDKDLRQYSPKNTEVLVYHGTTSKKLAKILAHGALDPKISGTPENKSYDNSSEGIFVTTNLGIFGAEMYSWHATSDEKTGDQSDQVILELSVPWRWIEPDPDDSRVNESGEPNDASYIQGRILRPINIKRIRQLRINNPILSEHFPPGQEDLFSPNKTDWVTIGQMMDLIQKLVDKNAPLKEEYYQMAGARPRGLSRSPAHQDREQQIAESLVCLLHTFFSPGDLYHGKTAHDASLVFVYQNGISGFEQASKVVPTYFESLEPGGWSVVEDSGGDYLPQPGETLLSYLNRVC